MKSSSWDRLISLAVLVAGMVVVLEILDRKRWPEWTGLFLILPVGLLLGLFERFEVRVRIVRFVKRWVRREAGSPPLKGHTDANLPRG